VEVLGRRRAGGESGRYTSRREAVQSSNRASCVFVGSAATPAFPVWMACERQVGVSGFIKTSLQLCVYVSVKRDADRLSEGQ
jgi:hypothetical protein